MEVPVLVNTKAVSDGQELMLHRPKQEKVESQGGQFGKDDHREGERSGRREAELGTRASETA